VNCLEGKILTPKNVPEVLESKNEEPEYDQGTEDKFELSIAENQPNQKEIKKIQSAKKKLKV